MPESVWLLSFVAAFCFGLALVLTQFGLRSLPAGTGAAISIPSSALLFWALAPFLLDTDGWDGRAAAIFAVVGLLFPAFVTLLTFEANRRLGPNATGALGNLAPVFAVLFAVAVLGEAPTAARIGGTAAVVLGITAISAGRNRAGGGWPLWALLLPLGAAAIRGGIQPAVKLGLGQWDSPFAAALIGYTVSSLVVIGARAGRARRRRGRIDRRGVAWFVAVGLCNGAAVLTLYAALARGSVTVVAPIVGTYPLVTVALGRAMLRQPVTSWMLAGVAATVAGVGLILIG